MHLSFYQKIPFPLEDTLYFNIMNPGRILILLTTFLACCSHPVRAGEKSYVLPGDPQRGIELFFSRDCVPCHSAFGGETKREPHLEKKPIGHLSATQMAAAMWNHAPQMWEQMGVGSLAPSMMSREEMTDLFAFLYSVRYFDEPGNPDRGKALLAKKNCIVCHAVQGEGEADGPDLTEGVRYANPVLWAQKMWNHASSMEQMVEDRNIGWPEFRDSDLIDIFSYIRSAAPPQETRVYLIPADPQAGAALFSKKRCSACHATGASGERAGPNFGESGNSLPRTLTRFAQLMWNHEPAMRREMLTKKISRPTFSEREMADLIAFLYSARFIGRPGDPIAGADIFTEKGCRTCHPSDAQKRRADLGNSADEIRPPPVEFCRTMWNHGMEMVAGMEEREIPWPRIDEREMVDLIEFLRVTDIAADTGADKK